ncbi:MULTISPECIES: site-specific integrase [Halomonadaceae]|uniref:Tyr recombinase domain-containing protein n=1 Tax=Modicisalibacter ilicicola DSM 19980 TaxID=1121942 RepID=A0A1M5DHC9_9GAMM|nr:MULTISPECIES: site-specific integrase [Halomonas]SHF66326.1 hypothetical protein SAMN02745148_03240 [Halomonas ilicicola DSM 19980]
MAYLRTTCKAHVAGLKSIKGFPLILTEDYRVNWLTLHFIFYLARKSAVSSVKTYAVHLTDFYSQLEVDKLDVFDVDDDWLSAYKQYLIRRNDERPENTQNYASQVIRTVVLYCSWLTEQGFSDVLCGEGIGYNIQISAGRKGGIKHPLIKNENSDSKAISAPWTQWIEVIKKYGPKREDLARRFELMIDWGRLGGLRAHEICGLKVWQLPDKESAFKKLEKKRKIKIKLFVTKGGEEGCIYVPPLLVIKTWEYVEIYRRDVVRKHKKIQKKKRENYLEPDYIFLSDATGGPSTPRGFSNTVRKAFLTAVEDKQLSTDERVWLHGLRHNFISLKFKAADDMKIKHSENYVRQSSRHKSVDSLGGYSSGRFDEDFS